jgi:pseudouridine kinase
MGEHILVIGATLMDVKGKPVAGLEPATSNPARIRMTRGGTARNVAENLGLLGAEVILITAVGQDKIGAQLLAQTAAANVNIDYALQHETAATGAYMALIENDGSLSMALDDVRAMEAVTAGYLHRNRRLFRDAALVMMDGSLSPNTMQTVARLTAKYQVPLCADPSSARLAYKLRPYLSQLHLVVPNELEAAELLEVDFFGSDPDASLDLARLLVRAGVENAIITLSNFGLDYATSDEIGYIPSNYSEIVDNTGTGDAVTAAIMFGMLNGLAAIESIRLGAAAASLTVQTNETVVPHLSLDMLYDHLIV